MCHFFSPDLANLPLIILNEPLELDVAIPAGLAEILLYLLLDGGWDEALTIAKLIIIGAAMAVDEVLTHIRLHLLWHVVIEDVHHALGKLHLLGLAEKGAVGRAYILETGIDTGISTSVVRHLLTHQIMQTTLLQGTLVCETKGIAFFGFFFEDISLVSG